MSKTKQALSKGSGRRQAGAGPQEWQEVLLLMEDDEGELLPLSRG